MCVRRVASPQVRHHVLALRWHRRRNGASANTFARHIVRRSFRYGKCSALVFPAGSVRNADPQRQRSHLEELRVGDQMLLARDSGADGLGSDGDQHMLGMERLALNLETVAAGEPRLAVIGIDAFVGIALLVLAGHRVVKPRLNAISSGQESVQNMGGEAGLEA